MLFNSLEFLAFLSVVVLVFAISPKSTRRYILFIGSLIFYGSWNISYLFLILFIIVSSYFSGLILNNFENSTKKTVLAFSILCVLVTLFIFKYGNFVIDTINIFLGSLKSSSKFNSLPFLLPVGISFFTFQAIGYVVDVYKKRIDPEKNFIDYSLFIAFFPQLVAGPIERAGNILPQLKHNLYPLSKNVSDALFLILSGFFKKLVIADRLCILVDKVYSNPVAASPYQVILATYFFSFQIYCDFSGYTDIARGVAKLFNVELMENFNRPYFATSIRDFWRRWHISLSTWFRDYLYIPLGGSRRSQLITVVNILVVFSLCGLWHGAAYTFIMWGLLHGVLLVMQHLLESAGFQNIYSSKSKVFRFIKILITFHLVTITWVFFRSKAFSDAAVIFRKISEISNFYKILLNILNDYEVFLGLVFILVLLLFETISISKFKLASTFDKLSRPRRIFYNSLSHVVLFYLILGFGVFDLTTFIYFQF